jgi:tripartite-type tricarboxylate transporter receptor subunit TctC
MSQQLSTAWGHPVVVDNRPGAGTTIGAAIVAKAPADGHTLLIQLAYQEDSRIARDAAAVG